MPPHYRAIDELPEVLVTPDFALRPGLVLAHARRKYGPIFRTVDYAGHRQLYVVGPEANRMVMVSDHVKFSNYEGWNRTDSVVETLGNGLIFMDGPEHQRLRAAAFPAFSPLGVAGYVSTMNTIIADRLAAWRDGFIIDLYDEIYKITFEIAAVLLIGMERGPGVDRLSSLFHELMSLNVRSLHGLASSAVSATLRRREIRAELWDLVRPAIAHQRQSSCTALSQMASSLDSHGRCLSEDALVAHANSLLLAGHITTSSLCAFLLYQLAGDQDSYDRVIMEQRLLGIRPPEIEYQALASMRILELALKESERMFPPVPSLPRGVSEDVVFGGYRIPKGETLFCSIAGVHMSDDLFPEPEKFDPSRFAPPRAEHRATLLSLVGFSAGPRRCLGLAMAKVEIKLIIAHVLSRFHLNTLPGNQAVPLYHPVLSPLRGLRVLLSAL